MKMMRGLLMMVATLGLAASATLAFSAEQSKSEMEVYQSAQGFSVTVPPALLAPETIEEIDPQDPTAAVYFLDQREWLVGIIYTKIRPDYPKDFSVIEQQIEPTQRQAEDRYGRSLYSVETQRRDGDPYLLVSNRRPSFSGRSDLEFFRHMALSFDPDNRCECQRVDLHFTRDGYYVQVISIANTATGMTLDEALDEAKRIALFVRDGVVPDSERA